MIVPKAKKLPSGTWFIYLRLGGEKIPVTAYTEKECIRQAELAKAEYRAGKRSSQKEPKQEVQKLPTLGDAIDAYIRKRDAVLSPSTVNGYKSIKRTRFKKYMDTSLSEISVDTWQTACNAEAKLCSAKTLKNAWALIASVLQDVGLEAPKVKLPQLIPNERPFLEPEQIHIFIKAVKGTSVEIPALLALHSLRRSEILALKWESIDFEKKIIHVKGAAVLDENNRLVQKPENKNASSTRDVPIMIDELFQALKKGRQPDGLIVTCCPTTIWQRINSICKNYRLPLVGVHGLRHSFVSLAYHIGVPEKVVMEIGGWSDYQTMRKIYTHVARSDVQKYTEQFASFFSAEKSKQKRKQKCKQVHFS